MKKYIELNSMYRNRNEYPNPAFFSVNFSQKVTINQLKALDPVSYAYPIVIFNGFGYGNEHYVTCTYNTPSSGIINLSTHTRFVVSAVIKTLNRRDNYYTGCAISTNEPQTRRITEFLYLNSKDDYDYFSITIDIPFTSTSKEFSIYNPSDFNDYNNLFLFIPTSVNIDNYIANYYIYNYTKGDYTKISGFDGTTHIAKLNTPTKLGWDINDYFSVAKEPVSVYGILSYGAVALLEKVNDGFGYPPNAINVPTNSTTGIDLAISWVDGKDGKIPELISIFYPGIKYNIGDVITVPYDGIIESSYTTFKVVSVYPSPGNIVFSEPINNKYINSFIRILINSFDSIQQIVSFYNNVAFLKDNSYIQPIFISIFN